MRSSFSRLVFLVPALAVQAQVTVLAPADLVLRPGDRCTLQAAAATAAALEWTWSLPAGGGSLEPGAGGRAVYTAPFVLEPETVRVRAAVAGDPSACAEVALRVHPAAALECLDRILGDWRGPRTEPFVGPDGVSMGVYGKAWENPVGSPRGLTSVDLSSEGLGQCWLFGDAGSATIKAATAEGRVKVLAGQLGGVALLDGNRQTARLGVIEHLEVIPASPSRPLRIFITELGSDAIRRVDLQGRVETYAGVQNSGEWEGWHRDGDRAGARFRRPRGLAADAAGNLYVADVANLRIRRIGADGQVGTLAEFGEGTRLGSLVLDEARGVLYVQDGRRLLRVTLAGEVSVLAGDRDKAGSVESVAELKLPAGSNRLAGVPCFGSLTGLRMFRGLLFIANTSMRCLEALDPDSGEFRQVAGFYNPAGDVHYGPLAAEGKERPAIGDPLTLGFSDDGVCCFGGTERLSLLYLDASVAGPKWDRAAESKPESKAETSGDSKGETKREGKGAGQ